MQNPAEDGLLSNYRIFETAQFQKDLIRITKSGQHKVGEKLLDYVYPRLRSHPHLGPNIRKLRGFHPETWRYRIGAWRFFFEIDDHDKIVYMIAAVHRGSAY
jgi:mRNA interferase RelE/StbE